MNKLIPPVIVNRHHKVPYDMYIGRGSMWGNPYKVDESIGITREMAIELYREDVYKCLAEGDITIDDIKALSGLRLACSCAPRACHGDVLVEIFNAIMELENESGESNE